MKLAILLLMSLISLSLFALDDEIKSKDMNNTEVNYVDPSQPNAPITPEQMENLKKQVETLKANQKNSEEMMNELDKE